MRTLGRTGMAGRWRLEPDEASTAGSDAVQRLLRLPLLQCLAARRAGEMEILESDDVLEMIQVCLDSSAGSPLLAV